MAPLDFGSTVPIHVVDPLRVTAPEAYETLGGYLQAVRERRGEDLEELAEDTRIRRQYLVALEEGDRSALPSRPFAIGYVRAYAAALGLDAEVAAARFKAEWPEGDQRLRNPVGIGKEGDASRPIIYAAIAVVVAAVALWNVAQRTLINDDPAPRTAGAIAGDGAPPAAPAGPTRLAAPAQAPAESSPPPPYLTPGMDPAADAAAAVAAAKAAALKAALLPSDGPTAFVTKRPIVGASAGPLLLQARVKSVSLVVRRPDASIAFATVLQPGEAFRAPAGAPLTAETSDPGAVDAYVNGKLIGALGMPQTALDKLAPAPPPAPVAVAPGALPATAAPPNTTAGSVSSAPTASPQPASGEAPQG